MSETTSGTDRAEREPGAGDQPLELLLDHLKRSRGFDFTGYKRSSLERRIAKRIGELELDGGYLGYLDHLEVHPDEFAALFDTILVNVTAFFRDTDAWEYLAREIVPKLLVLRPTDAPLRIWSAGCSSGEEAYTIAIVLAEALGRERFVERVKIYATDVDEDALATARLGSYSAQQVAVLPQPLLERYFDRVGTEFRFNSDLRRTVIFGRNDLVQDAPISRIDLLLCRNTLMYFNAETQSRILGRFNFSLDPNGYLFLGKSEMLITHTDLFTPVNLKRRVFRKVRTTSLRDRLLAADRASDDNAGEPGLAMRQSGFDAAPVAQVIAGEDGRLVLANRLARELFALTGDDLGRPLRELGLSYRPLELPSAIERATHDRRSLTRGPVAWTTGGGEAVELEVLFTPLCAGETLLGVSIAYRDVSERQRLREELDRTRHELETSYEELQSTVEELETTNEELQSTNEELETTNEELQSTNEELETTNEELQSTNEELEAINDDLRERTGDVDAVNLFLETVLTSLGVGVIVLDAERKVQVWNAHAEELWGLRSGEVVGERFFELDVGLPVEQLKTPIREAMRDRSFRADVSLASTTRRGRAIECTVAVLPLAIEGTEIAGAVLLMEVRGESPAGES
jgi:two-component system CheB/CheR fusion protein